MCAVKSVKGWGKKKKGVDDQRESWWRRSTCLQHCEMTKYDKVRRQSESDVSIVADKTQFERGKIGFDQKTELTFCKNVNIFIFFMLRNAKVHSKMEND